MQTTRSQPRTRPSRRSSRFAVIVALVSALALLAAACGGDDDVSAGSSGDPAVVITAPAVGARVGRSFDVAMDLSFPIGEPDTGRQHIHLHYDGSPDYDIVYEDTHTADLEPGEHTIVAVVANADHSETDSRSREVTVEVTDGDPGTGTTDLPPTTGPSPTTGLPPTTGGDLGY